MTKIWRALKVRGGVRDAVQQFDKDGQLEQTDMMKFLRYLDLDLTPMEMRQVTARSRSINALVGEWATPLPSFRITFFESAYNYWAIAPKLE